MCIINSYSTFLNWAIVSLLILFYFILFSNVFCILVHDYTLCYMTTLLQLHLCMNLLYSYSINAGRLNDYNSQTWHISNALNHAYCPFIYFSYSLFNIQMNNMHVTILLINTTLYLSMYDIIITVINNIILKLVLGLCYIAWYKAELLNVNIIFT